jgi:hypothetical protein
MSLRDKFGTLPKFKMIGPDKATMCCPGPSHACGDKNPSLSARETPEGVILLKCWAGCKVHEILQAMGMEPADLYPTPAHSHLPKMRRPFTASDALAGLEYSSLVLVQIANQLETGAPLSEADRRSLLRAATRIQCARKATQ